LNCPVGPGASLTAEAPDATDGAEVLLDGSTSENHVCPPGCLITPYTDGPYLLRGNFRITDEKGNQINLTRKTVALCRCGRSQIKPWCDGTHKLIRFRAASAPAGAESERVS
jgi:CDGSH-type Zn-finger protein